MHVSKKWGILLLGTVSFFTLLLLSLFQYTNRLINLESQNFVDTRTQSFLLPADISQQNFDAILKRAGDCTVLTEVSRNVHAVHVNPGSTFFVGMYQDVFRPLSAHPEDAAIAVAGRSTLQYSTEQDGTHTLTLRDKGQQEREFTVVATLFSRLHTTVNESIFVNMAGGVRLLGSNAGVYHLNGKNSQQALSAISAYCDAHAIAIKMAQVEDKSVFRLLEVHSLSDVLNTAIGLFNAGLLLLLALVLHRFFHTYTAALHLIGVSKWRVAVRLQGQFLLITVPCLLAANGCALLLTRLLPLAVDVQTILGWNALALLLTGLLFNLAALAKNLKNRR